MAEPINLNEQPSREFDFTIDADEMEAAGVRIVELIEGEPPTGATRRLLEKSDARVNRLSARITELEGQLAAVTRERGEWIKRAGDYAEQVNQAIDRLGTTERQLAEANARAEAAERELAQFKGWLDKESAFLSKDDLVATLVERAEQAEARAGAAEDELEHLGQLITEHDGIECTKHDMLVRLAVEERKKAEARAADLAERCEKLEGQRDNAEARQEQATEQVVELRKALKVYANKAMWVKYERDDEMTASIFIGNKNGVEDGVLCDGWRFAHAALNPDARQEGSAAVEAGEGRGEVGEI